MKTCLIDVNVLLALAWPHHAHHNIAHQWWQTAELVKWSTCTQTQLGFVRISCNPKFAPIPAVPQQAMHVLGQMTARSDHEFWTEVPNGTLNAGLAQHLSSCHAHGHVTDAYLAALAEHHSGQLATLDRSLASHHAKVAILVA